MNERRYSQLIRLAAVVVAIALWVVSVQFSVDGFNFVLPKYRWVGYLLAFAVTIIEVVFNEEGMRHSLTLVAVGLLTYAYGVVTNVIGVWAAQGAPDPTDAPWVMLFPLMVGFFLEVSPEPLLMWGLVGTGVRDLLGQLIAGRGEREERERRGAARWREDTREREDGGTRWDN